MPLPIWLERLHPRYWILSAAFDPVWDRELRAALAAYSFQYRSAYTVFLGHRELWVANRPYASFRRYGTSQSGRPSRRTIIEAYRKLKVDLPEFPEEPTTPSPLAGHFYILDSYNQPVPVEAGAWSVWFETADRTVARTTVAPNVEVSTVFTGLNAGWNSTTPLLWESMIFGGPLDGRQQRYSSRAEALTGHNALVSEAQTLTVPIEYISILVTIPEDPPAEETQEQPVEPDPLEIPRKIGLID